MSSDERYSYFFDDSYLLYCDTKTFYVRGKGHKNLDHGHAFDVLRILIENKGKPVDAIELAVMVYGIKVEKLEDRVEERKRKDEVKRTKGDLHGVIIQWRAIFNDFQGDRIIATTSDGYCFKADVTKVLSEDIDLSDPFRKFVPVKVDPDEIVVPGPAGDELGKTFRKWLWGKGRLITSILIGCVILTSVISLALSTRPIRDTPTFIAEDIKDAKGLSAKLSNEQKGPMSSYICSHSITVKDTFCANRGSQLSEEQLSSIFNEFIDSPSLANDARDRTEGGQLVNRRLLEEAFPEEIRKIKNVTWGRPLSILLQWFTILIALFYGVVKYRKNDDKGLELNEKVKGDLKAIKYCWFGLFLSWLFLYSFLFIFSVEESFHLGRQLNVSSETFDLLFSFLATIFNYVNTIFIVCCFTYLNKQGEKEEESTRNIFIFLILGLGVITLAVHFISYLISGTGDGVSNELDLFTGIVAGVFMALLVGRLQSKFFGTRPWLLIFLYSYTALQPLYFYLTANGVSDIWIISLIDLYLILKCLLYLYIAWLFESTRLSFYLVEIKERHRDIEKSWDRWLSKIRPT